MKITKGEFGMTKDNKPISLYTIENASGASVTLSDYGCRIIKIMVPNKEGKLTDVILGLMNADEYLADDASLGAVVGRCANRIAKGHFTLNDKEYNLAINNGPNCMVVLRDLVSVYGPEKLQMIKLLLPAFLRMEKKVIRVTLQFPLPTDGLKTMNYLLFTMQPVIRILYSLLPAMVISI